jgi:recoverin
MIKPEDVKLLPDDENTPEKRAEKIWAFFGKKEDGELLCRHYVIVTSDFTASAIS